MRKVMMIWALALVLVSSGVAWSKTACRTGLHPPFT